MFRRALGATLVLLLTTTVLGACGGANSSGASSTTSPAPASTSLADPSSSKACATISKGILTESGTQPENAAKAASIATPNLLAEVASSYKTAATVAQTEGQIEVFVATNAVVAAVEKLSNDILAGGGINSNTTDLSGKITELKSLCKIN